MSAMVKEITTNNKEMGTMDNETCDACSSGVEVEGGLCAECFSTLPNGTWVILEKVGGDL